MRVLRKAAIVVLVSSLLGAPGASALEPPPREPQRIAWSIRDLSKSVERLFSWLVKAGCTIDPWGGAQAPSSDAGCMIDPWGRCVAGD